MSTSTTSNTSRTSKKSKGKKYEPMALPSDDTLTSTPANELADMSLPLGYTVRFFPHDMRLMYTAPSKHIRLTQGVIDYIREHNQQGPGKSKAKLFLCTMFERNGSCENGFMCREVHCVLKVHSAKMRSLVPPSVILPSRPAAVLDEETNPLHDATETLANAGSDCVADLESSLNSDAECPSMASSTSSTIGRLSLGLVDPNDDEIVCTAVHMRNAPEDSHPRLPPGVVYRLALPNMQSPNDDIPSENVFVTKGAKDYYDQIMSGETPTMNMQHCAHFSKNGMCCFGSDCQFVHVAQYRKICGGHDTDSSAESSRTGDKGRGRSDSNNSSRGGSEHGSRCSSASSSKNGTTSSSGKKSTQAGAATAQQAPANQKNGFQGFIPLHQPVPLMSNDAFQVGMAPSATGGIASHTSHAGSGQPFTFAPAPQNHLYQQQQPTLQASNAGGYGGSVVHLGGGPPLYTAAQGMYTAPMGAPSGVSFVTQAQSPGIGIGRPVAGAPQPSAPLQYAAAPTYAQHQHAHQPLQSFAMFNPGSQQPVMPQTYFFAPAGSGADMASQTSYAQPPQQHQQFQSQSLYPGMHQPQQQIYQQSAVQSPQVAMVSPPPMWAQQQAQQPQMYFVVPPPGQQVAQHQQNQGSFMMPTQQSLQTQPSQQGPPLYSTQQPQSHHIQTFQQQPHGGSVPQQFVVGSNTNLSGGGGLPQLSTSFAPMSVPSQQQQHPQQQQSATFFVAPGTQPAAQMFHQQQLPQAGTPQNSAAASFLPPGTSNPW